MEGVDPRQAPLASVEVEIVYGRTGAAQVIRQQVPGSATLRQAIELSGILEMHPDIDLDSNKVGVFSRKKELHNLVNAGDRIEIYQVLKVDPKEARRRRAKK